MKHETKTSFQSAGTSALETQSGFFELDGDITAVPPIMPAPKCGTEVPEDEQEPVANSLLQPDLTFMDDEESLNGGNDNKIRAEFAPENYDTGVDQVMITSGLDDGALKNSDEESSSTGPEIPAWTGGNKPGDGSIYDWGAYGTKFHETHGTYTGRDVLSRGEYKMADGEVSFENLMKHIGNGAGKGTYLYTRIEGNDGDNIIYGWRYDNWDNYNGGSSIKDYYVNYHHRDNISGGDGNDIIYADRGNDQLFGDAGDDVIYGGGGHDYIEGGTGNDQLFGESGNDKIVGGEGKNILVGGSGDDILVAGNEGDKLYGGTGNDKLYGGDGDDILFTGHIHENSEDILYGGKGADTFVIGGVPEPTSHDPNHGSSSNALGESWLDEAGNLALAKMVPGVKLMMMLGKSLVEGLKNMFKTEEQVVETVDPPKVSLVEIRDFNPLEDKIIVPVNVDGPVTFKIDESIVAGAAFDLLVVTPGKSTPEVLATFYWDEATNIFPGATDILERNTEAFIQRLKETAFITGPDGVQYGLETPVDLGLSSEDVASLGTSKFVALGAFGGISMVGHDGSDRQMGTNHNDVLQAYLSDRDAQPGDEVEIRNDGNDVLYGFGGDDILAGGGGFNKLFGGDDNDTAWYGDSLSGIYVDMNNTDSDNNGEYFWAWHGNSANAFDINDSIRNKPGYDFLWSIENIYGSDYTDVIIGNDEDNIFTSGFGNDQLTGNGGADTFILTGDENTITDFNADDGDRIEIDLDAYGMSGWFDLGHRIENGKIVLVNQLTGKTIVRYDDDGTGFDPSVVSLRSLKGNEDDGYQVVYEPAYGANTLEWFEKYGNRVDVETGETGHGTDSWDYMIGGDGNDLTNLHGGGGDDYIVGGGQSLSTLDGGDGNDIILIRKGAMFTNANGGDGDDVIILDADQSSQAGYAELYGGDGNDTFVITGPGNKYGGQVIRDFDEDDAIIIDLEGFGISSLDQLQVNWSSNSFWIKANGQKVITVQGVDEDYDIMQHISGLTTQQSEDWGL